MPSAALDALLVAITEVAHLAIAGATQALPGTLLRARATGRAQTVLLSSHFERYFYAVNEEAVTYLNANVPKAASLPLALRLLHSKEPLDNAAQLSWENRKDALTALFQGEGWLWAPTTTGALVHSRLLAWMSAPKPKNLIRYYRYWDVDDIFSAITRSTGSRDRLWLGVQELVDKRNNIAHGDFTAQATNDDVKRYTDSVRTFCTRADRRLARQLGDITSKPRPW